VLKKEESFMSPEKEYLSVEEVADTLGVTYQLIYKLVRSGELPAARLGKLYRVSKKDLDAYLEKSKLLSGTATCSVCGTTYQSRQSLVQHCLECDELICSDCWGRRKVRHCRQHTPKEK
jgi:excisionase family DNA binding protein